MERKNGFTLIELLAVIVVLSIILVIATSSVIKNINDSRAKAKYIAAKEIVDIASAYIETETDGIYIETETDGIDKECVKVKDLIDKDYLEKDVTNPKTGENGNIDDNQAICKSDSFSSKSQVEYGNNNGKGYYFDGYMYNLN